MSRSRYRDGQQRALQLLLSTTTTKLMPAGGSVNAVHEALQRALGLDGDGEREGGEDGKGKGTSDFSKLLELKKDKLEKE
jgi:hypothetical protein